MLNIKMLQNSTPPELRLLFFGGQTACGILQWLELAKGGKLGFVLI